MHARASVRACCYCCCDVELGAGGSRIWAGGQPRGGRPGWEGHSPWRRAADAHGWLGDGRRERRALHGGEGDGGAISSQQHSTAGAPPAGTAVPQHPPPTPTKSQHPLTPPPTPPLPPPHPLPPPPTAATSPPTMNGLLAELGVGTGAAGGGAWYSWGLEARGKMEATLSGGSLLRYSVDPTAVQAGWGSTGSGTECGL